MEAKVSFCLTTDFHVCLSKQLHTWLWRLGARSHVVQEAATTSFWNPEHWKLVFAVKGWGEGGPSHHSWPSLCPLTLSTPAPGEALCSLSSLWGSIFRRLAGDWTKILGINRFGPWSKDLPPQASATNSVCHPYCPLEGHLLLSYFSCRHLPISSPLAGISWHFLAVRHDKVCFLFNFSLSVILLLF